MALLVDWSPFVEMVQRGITAALLIVLVLVSLYVFRAFTR